MPGGVGGENFRRSGIRAWIVRSEAVLKRCTGVPYLEEWISPHPDTLSRRSTSSP